MGLASTWFQAVPPAPGQPAAPGGAPKATATEQQPAPAGGDEEAAPPPGGALGMLFPLLLLVPLLLLMFWSSRKQQKKQQEQIASLKKGDRVVTQAGIVGKLVELGDRYAKLEIAPGVRIDLLKSGLVGKEAEASAEKK